MSHEIKFPSIKADVMSISIHSACSMARVGCTVPLSLVAYAERLNTKGQNLPPVGILAGVQEEQFKV